MLPEFGAEEIKTIGDEVMIRATDPGEAVRLGLRIVDELAAPGSPPVRVGMHSGPAVPLDGDWFGGVVNLAARVAGAARAGEVLLTEETVRQSGKQEGFEFEPHGSRRFRHLPDPVPVYRAVGSGGVGRHLEIDPVCRMAVDPEDAAGVRRRRGYSYYFCSEGCERAFAAEPRHYIGTSDAARAARKGFLVNLVIFLVVGGAHLIAWAGGSEPHASMFLLFGAWALAIALHYRAVRRVL